MLSSSIPKSLIGHAGEHYVIYRLYRRGLLAALAPAGTEITDILVLAADGETVGCSLQVKTRAKKAKRPSWPMNVKHEVRVADRLLYAFVDLGSEPPETFIIPSTVVARAVSISHQTWLAGVPTRGTSRRDTPMRMVTSSYAHDVPGFLPGWMEEWRERWDLIEAAAAQPGGAVLSDA